jgi:PPOX class probable F420-dependent enzyme
VTDAPTIPDSHLDLLTAGTVVLSTSNADGTIQSTAIWVHYGDDGVLRTSLAKARQKYRNLRARPDQATICAISTTDAFHTLEIRASVEFADDTDRSFFAELLAPYGHTLETFSAQTAEDRCIVTFTPTRVRAS